MENTRRKMPDEHLAISTWPPCPFHEPPKTLTSEILFAFLPLCLCVSVVDSAFRHFQNDLRHPIGCGPAPVLRLQTAPHLVEALQHRSAGLAVGDRSSQLGRDPLWREVRLYQLRHDVPFRDQVHHRKAVYFN